jgi:serine/threonine-protein phosphatase 5
LEHYLSAIQHDPHHCPLYTNAANCFFKLAEFERSIEFCDAALTLNPALTKAVYRRGLALAALKLYKSAVDDLRRVGRAMPEDGEVKRVLEECERELRKSLFVSAIRKDTFRLDRPSIDKVDVDPNYRGPHISGHSIDMPFVTELISWYRQDKRLHPKYVYEILLQSKALFEKEPNLVRVSVREGQRLTICGDTHGQFFDLVKLFEVNGLPSERHIYVPTFYSITYTNVCSCLMATLWTEGLTRWR